MALDNKFFKTFTFLLVIFGFLGTKLFTVGLGAFELSVFRVLIVVAFPLFLFSKQSIKKRYGNRYYKFLGFWVIYSLCMIVFVQDFGSFLKYFIFLFSAFLVTYYTCCNLTRKDDYVKVLLWFERIAVVFSLIGLYEIITGDYHFVDENSFTFYETQSMLVSTIGVRVPISVFANPNDFGLFLLFALFVSIALVHIKKEKKARAFSMILIAYFSFLIVSTQSRSIFMSLLGGVILYVFFDFKTWSKKLQLGFVITVLLSLSTIVTWLVANKDMYMALISIGEDSDDVRLNLIKYGLIILKSTLFLGTNVGNIETHMAQFSSYTNDVVNIHNWWMEVLVSSGVVVFIIYIRIYVSQIFFYIRNWNRTNDRVIRNVSLSFLCFMISFILGSITSSSIFPTEWMWTAFCVIFSFPEVFKQQSNNIQDENLSFVQRT